MSFMNLTSESLSAALGESVPELYVVIAKNAVMGIDSYQMADLLGVSVAEIQDVEVDATYKNVRLLVASEYTKGQLEKESGWDELERIALNKLVKKAEFENDVDSLLRIAAVANKAQRRSTMNQNKVLDPAAGGTRVPLTLSRRLVQRINSDGSKEITETQQISVLGGTAKNPTFDEIDGLLGVSHMPAIPSKMKIQTREPDFGVDDLEYKSK